MEALDLALTESNYLHVPVEYFDWVFVADHKSQITAALRMWVVWNISRSRVILMSPDLSDGNLRCAKANILRPLQQRTKHQIFHKTNAAMIKKKRKKKDNTYETECITLQ